MRLLKQILAIILLSLALGSCASPPQTITICKKTLPPGGTGFQFSHSNNAGQLLSFPLNDNQCGPLFIAANQDHFNIITETTPPDWMLTNITCSSQTSPTKFIGTYPNPAFQLGDNTVTIDLNEPNVTCTFFNQPCCRLVFNVSTGQGNAATDPMWMQNSNPAFITPNVSAWLTIPSAGWIQPLPSPLPAPNVPPGNFQYTLDFTLAPCSQGHYELHGTFAADNSAQAFLDNVPITGASCSSPCFATPPAPVPINVVSIPPGPHTLRIDVNNAGGFSGLIVSAEITGKCP